MLNAFIVYCIAANRTVARQRPQNNDKMAIALKQFRKYATVLRLLLDSGPRATIEVLLEAVFPMEPLRARIT
jgi:hypothetical protein